MTEEFKDFDFCAVCYVAKGVHENLPTLEQYNRHFETVHHSQWRWLGAVGPTNLMLADPSQLHYDPSILQNLYQAVTVWPESAFRPGEARYFETNDEKRDSQIIIVKRSDGAGGGCEVFGRVGNERSIHVGWIEEVRLVWEGEVIDASADRDYKIFASSVFCRVAGFSKENPEFLDALKKLLLEDEEDSEVIQCYTCGLRDVRMTMVEISILWGIAGCTSHFLCKECSTMANRFLKELERGRWSKGSGGLR